MKVFLAKPARRSVHSSQPTLRRKACLNRSDGAAGVHIYDNQGRNKSVVKSQRTKLAMLFHLLIQLMKMRKLVMDLE